MIRFALGFDFVINLDTLVAPCSQKSWYLLSDPCSVYIFTTMEREDDTYVNVTGKS